MPIDRTGEWWSGESYADLVEYLEALTQDGYPADQVRQASCHGWRGTTFSLRAECEEGAAVRRCATCDFQAFIADSEEAWDGDGGQQCRCPCGEMVFEVAVGFSLRPSGDVRWVTVANRCIACGLLGAFIDWGVDYGPSAHLVDQA